jgi:transcriptional regulator with XRE-family HTH domain
LYRIYNRRALRREIAEMARRLDFGNFCRRKRLEAGKTLREFCRENGFDAAWISRIERGVATPPKAKRVRDRLAVALEVQENSEDWIEFHDLADLCAGRLPDRVSDDERVLELLPLFFRTMGKKDVDEERLRLLVEKLKQELP